MKKLLVTATLLSSEHEAREKGRGGERGGNKLRSKPSLVVQIGPKVLRIHFLEKISNFVGM